MIKIKLYCFIRQCFLTISMNLMTVAKLFSNLWMSIMLQEKKITSVGELTSEYIVFESYLCECLYK